MADRSKEDCHAHLLIAMFREPMEPILQPENRALMAAFCPVMVKEAVADKSCGSFSSSKKESTSREFKSTAAEDSRVTVALGGGIFELGFDAVQRSEELLLDSPGCWFSR